MTARLPATLLDQVRDLIERNPDREITVERGDVRITIRPAQVVAQTDDSRILIVP